MIGELHDGSILPMTAKEAQRAHAECRLASVTYFDGDNEGEKWAKWCAIALYLGTPVPKLTKIVEVQP